MNKKKKLLTAVTSGVLACAFSLNTALSASAGELTAEELYNKYAFTYEFRYGQNVVKQNDTVLRDSGWYARQVASYKLVQATALRHATDSETRTQDGFTYRIMADGNAVITGIDADYLNENSPEEIIIPETIGGAVVTEIGASAFSAVGYQIPKLRKIVIPDTVEWINTHAFSSAFWGSSAELNQREINMPQSVKYIGEEAFTKLGSAFLTNREDHFIELPESLEYLDDRAFDNTSGQLHMPKSLVFVNNSLSWGDQRIIKVWAYDDVEPYLRDYYLFIDGESNTVDLSDMVRGWLDENHPEQPYFDRYLSFTEPYIEYYRMTVLYQRALKAAYEAGDEERIYELENNTYDPMELYGSKYTLDNYFDVRDTPVLPITLDDEGNPITETPDYEYDEEDIAHWEAVKALDYTQIVEYVDVSRSASAAPLPEILETIGDLNEDGIVDVLDAVMLARLATEDRSLVISEVGLARADINGDGAFNADDLTLLLDFLAG